MTDTEPEQHAATNWDHTVGVITFEVPKVDTLLFVAASTRPGSPILVDLTGQTPARIGSDRDRAVLRAFLKLALQRLGNYDHTERRIELR